MGKNLISQRRGRGTTTYRSPSFRFKADARHKSYLTEDSGRTVTGTITELTHCAGHTSPLMQIEYEDSEIVQTIAPEGVRVGDKVAVGPEAEIKSGNVLELKDIPEGTLIYNIESHVGDGGKFARSGGSFARLLSKTKDNAMIMLPSKKQKSVNLKCRASIGICAAGGRLEKPLLKAGNAYHKKRARNKLYPRTSGVAMNAVDHPFGGSSSAHKGRPTTVPKRASPGRKVGLLRARRTGRQR